jgi:hypothetical protein
MNLGTTPSAVLMLVAPMLPALTGAMVLGNWLVCSIPPARRALGSEARNVPGTDYRSSQRALIRLTAILLACATVLALVGAATLARR